MLAHLQTFLPMLQVFKAFIHFTSVIFYQVKCPKYVQNLILKMCMLWFLAWIHWYFWTSSGWLYFTLLAISIVFLYFASLFLNFYICRSCLVFMFMYTQSTSLCAVHRTSNFSPFNSKLSTTSKGRVFSKAHLIKITKFILLRTKTISFCRNCSLTRIFVIFGGIRNSFILL